MPKLNKRCCLVAISLFLLLPAFVLHAQPARERHERIRAAVEGGDYRAAITELESLSKSDPAVFALNNYDYLLARLSERTGNAALAQSLYQRVVARGSLLSQYALWHLAQLARVTGNLPLEREKLRQLLASAPASLLRDAAQARLGESFFESRDYAAAISALRPRSSASGNSSAREALALIAEAYVKSNQKEAARDAYSNLVAQLPNPSQPDDFALAGVRGLDVLDSGSEEAALKSAPQLAESEHLRRAQIYNFNRDFAGARRHYAAIVERYERSASVPEALYMIARGFYQERNFADALTYFQRVAKEHPESGQARDALGFAAASLSRLKRVDESLATYKSIIDRYGSGAALERAYLNIIDALRDAGGRDAEALSWIEQTRTRFKGQVTATLALFSRARIHLSQGEWAKALADFEALGAESNLGGANTPGSTNQREVAFMRAYLFEQLGRTEDAVNAYLAIPDGRNEYYGGRATQRLRGLGANEKTRSIILARLEALRAEAQKAIASNQFEEARKAAQSALRLAEDSAIRNELLDIARRAYASLPAYNSLPTPRLLSFGRQNVIASGQANPNNSPTHRALADELLFLGLADEGAPELAVAEKVSGSADAPADKSPAQDAAVTGKESTSPEKQPAAASAPAQSLSRDEAYTLAVLYKRGENANQAVRYAEPLWKKVPADYLLELAPREMVELLYPAPYRDALAEYAPPRGVDPRFVLSIMRQESRFRPEAKSNAAARGLLQFIPSTANQMATELGLKDFLQDDLYNPRMAVLFGSQYMGNLFRLFPDMPQAVAASYNGGEDNVARWVARARSNDPDRYTLEIGFAQSKDYIYKVVPNYWVYQSLYTEQLKRR